MASQSKIDTRKAILRTRGVPEAFIDNLANRGDGNITRFLVNLLFIGLFVSPLLILIFLLKDIMAFILPHLYADKIQSLLFYAPGPVGDWTAFVGVFMGLAFFAGALSLWVSQSGNVKPYPYPNAQASILRNLAPHEALTTIQPNARFAELAHLANDTAFLTAIRPAKPPLTSYLPVLTIIGIVVGFFALGLVSKMSEYKSVTLDSIEIRDRSDTTIYRLADAKYAYIVCYDAPESVRFRYRIVYPDATINLWQRRDILHGLEAEGVIDRLTLIDQKLTELGIPIHRMPLTGSPHLDGTGCVNQAAKLWGLKNTDKLNRLVFGP